MSRGDVSRGDSVGMEDALADCALRILALRGEAAAPTMQSDQRSSAAAAAATGLLKCSIMEAFLSALIFLLG